MKVAVLTATKRPGLDVTFEALRRQDHQNIWWIVVDALYEERKDEFWRRTTEVDFGITYMPELPRAEGYYSNLPAIYNQMIAMAVHEGCEIAVSLQDYIWPPAFGVRRFVRVMEEMPTALVTGLCSMLARPKAKSVYDPDGLWTIFREPYNPDRWSDEIEWEDVRGRGYSNLSRTFPSLWEMNWAAFPLTLGLRFDETWGEHIGNENQQFAWDAHLKHDCPIVIDPLNHALSLPHRHYWPDEWEGQQEHRTANMVRYADEYGPVQDLMIGKFK